MTGCKALESIAAFHDFGQAATKETAYEAYLNAINIVDAHPRFK